jgi:hypothetical protein
VSPATRQLCLAKIPSGCKMNLVLDEESRFGEEFRLKWRYSLATDRCEDASKFATNGHLAHFSCSLSSISLATVRRANSGGQIVAMMQTA